MSLAPFSASPFVFSREIDIFTSAHLHTCTYYPDTHTHSSSHLRVYLQTPRVCNWCWRLAVVVDQSKGNHPTKVWIPQQAMAWIPDPTMYQKHPVPTVNRSLFLNTGSSCPATKGDPHPQDGSSFPPCPPTWRWNGRGWISCEKLETEHATSGCFDIHSILLFVKHVPFYRTLFRLWTVFPQDAILYLLKTSAI